MRKLLVVAGCLVSLGLPQSGAAIHVDATPTRIVFSSTFAGNREVETAEADGSNRVDLTLNPAADITPSWSADGRRIAFASNRTGSFEIYVMNADGSNVVQVTDDSAYDDRPRFTGFDKSIVYESRRGGNWEIRRIGVDGSGEVDLTRNPAADRDPSTNSHGTIAFTSDRGGTGDHVWVMRWNGTHPRQVTHQAGGQSQPAWDPTGAKLAFVAGSPGSASIWTALANGKELQRVQTVSGRDAERPAWSPDGASIVYQDCAPGTTTDCGLMTSTPGAAALDLSVLRAPYVDTFDGGDSRFWYVIQNGTGAVNTEENGELVTTLAADSVQGGQYDEIETHWGTQCRLVGDYDVQADYRLLEWPATNGVQAALSAFAGPDNVGFMAIRESQAWGEQYSSWIPQNFSSVPTGDPAGTLRLQRQGDTAITSFWSGSAWIPIASGPTITDPATITLGAGSGLDRFVHQEVKVAWDNFRINSGTISCGTPWWEDDSPDWHAAA